jgi:hypothetical protein
MHRANAEHPAGRAIAPRDLRDDFVERSKPVRVPAKRPRLEDAIKARHPELFDKILRETAIRLGPRRVQSRKATHFFGRGEQFQYGVAVNNFNDAIHAVLFPTKITGRTRI